MDTLLKYFQPDEKKADLLTNGLGCNPILSNLLIDRGVTNIDDARFFLNPNFKNLPDPFLLKDMDKAAKRIFTAIKNREKILIFGDFDADGVTSTALLCEFLEYCDADISWYIPHRIKEGYSLQINHIQMATDQNIDLIITVDCGVSSHDAVEKANFEDIDVIITDHHEPDTHMPLAHAVVNPKREDCNAGLDYLAGVGVAFFLVMALRKFLRDQNFWKEIAEPNLSNYLDLFTIGTIGDMVPLIHENRVLCIAGLKKIRQGIRPGLQSIAKACRLDLNKIDSDDISFKIVPRINAAGRMSHARICVSHLINTDTISCEKNATLLDQLNLKRQKVEQEIVNEIEQKILQNPELLDKKLLFLWNDKWNPSVLGIAASKLSKKYYCPVILLSSDGDNAVGSGRSINDINIYKALNENQALLEKYGGHKMACGLTVKTSNLLTLYENLDQYFKKTCSKHDFQKTKFIDAILKFKDINFDLARQIDQLRPFGMANPEPVFLCRQINVKSSYLIADKHRKMVLGNAASSNYNKVEAFHFNVEDPDNLPDFFSEIAFKLKINKFKKNTAQIIIEQL
ncbi:MAG: single-stranded-DNA-specific exonuclease RecJ [Desulfobacula sp.]|nr:single-stranded-DNA-specific exonuclease RecJ [Desulfobacula sp.]